jgi:hypothetical protein
MPMSKERKKELDHQRWLERGAELRARQRAEYARVNGHKPGFKQQRTMEEMAAIREGILEILALPENQPATCRQVFYQMVNRGLVEKTENECSNTVGRILIEMRRNGTIEYEAITDGTREVDEVQAYSSIAEMLDVQLRYYHRQRWDTQPYWIGIHLEKGTLAALFQKITYKWCVPLLVTHGFSSLTFAHDVGEAIEAADKPAFIFSFTDCDPSGGKLSAAFEKDIRESAGEIDLTFKRICLTPEQVKQWRLPTRPTKESNHSRDFEGESCELDAIPPKKLMSLIESCILEHLDRAAWDDELEVERREKAELREFIEARKDQQDDDPEE